MPGKILIEQTIEVELRVRGKILIEQTIEVELRVLGLLVVHISKTGDFHDKTKTLKGKSSSE